MTFLQAILLGAVQGLTEFLPVSSSGHLAITQHFLPNFTQPGVLFDVLLHLGTMIAVVIYFRRDLLRLATAPLPGGDPLARRTLRLLILASVPTAAIGLGFKDFFESLFDNLPLVAGMLLVTGTLLFISERLRARRRQRLEGELTLGDALLVGSVQGLAIIPGISRSGSTIATLLLKGVDGETAARFSFLLALPAVFGATLLQLRHLEQVPGEQLPAYLAGTLVAFVVGYASIHLLLAVVRRQRLIWFAGYCWLLGSGLLLSLFLTS